MLFNFCFFIVLRIPLFSFFNSFLGEFELFGLCSVKRLAHIEYVVSICVLYFIDATM